MTVSSLPRTSRSTAITIGGAPCRHISERDTHRLDRACAVHPEAEGRTTTRQRVERGHERRHLAARIADLEAAFPS
jgi:hypothetical protein